MSEARWGGQPPANLVPENAPFDEEQRAWLNGFLAGLLGLAGGEARGASEPTPEPVPPATNALINFPSGSATASAAARVEPAGVAAEPSPQASHTDPLDARGEPLAAAPRASEPSRATAPERAWVLGGAARRAVRGQGADLPASSVTETQRSRLVGLGREPGDAYRLRVKSQKKLTLADAGSEIREIVLEHDGPELRYQVGDCLAVFPHNDPDLVRALLRAVGARGQERVTTAHGSIEVWRCLLEDVDITHVRDQTLRLFADEAGRSVELDVLREAVSQATPSGFDLLDLLSMFPSSRPSLERIVGTLGALEPRLYAIASSSSHHAGELHLAVRVVRAERSGRERRGVASHFLSEGVFRGDDVFARVRSGERFVLPVDPAGPMIMLGSGTGLARYRAFLQELEARGRRGNTWLITASCFEGDEALYEAELKTWSRLGVLEHLDVVKLGQRGRRLGPEDVLRKRARRVASWLERGAHVYACGEGKGLSQVLSDTFIDVLGRQGKMSRSEAAEFLTLMRREGRYVEEVY